MLRANVVASIVGRLPGAVDARVTSAAAPSTALAARPPAVDSSSGGGLGRIAARFGADARVVALGAAAVPLAGCTEHAALGGGVVLICMAPLFCLALLEKLENIANAQKSQTVAIKAQTRAIREAAEASDPLFGHEARLEEVTQQLFDAFTTCVGTERIDTTPAEKIEAAIGLIASLDTDALRAEFPQQFLAAVLLGTLCELDAGRYDHAARCLAMAEKVKDRLNAHDQALLGLFVTYVIAKNSGDATEFVRVIENQGGALQVATFVRNTLAAACAAGLAAGNMVREFPAVQAMLGFIIAEAEAAKEKELASWLEKKEREMIGSVATPYTIGDILSRLQQRYAARQPYEALRVDLGASVPDFMNQIGYGVSVSDAVYAKLVEALAASFIALESSSEGELAVRFRESLQTVVKKFLLAHQSGIFAGQPGHDDNIRYIQALEEYLTGNQSPDSRGATERMMAVWLEKQRP